MNPASESENPTLPQAPQSTVIPSAQVAGSGESPASSSSSSSSPPPPHISPDRLKLLIVGGIGIVLLVVIGIVGLLFSSRKETIPSTPVTVQKSSPTDAPIPTIPPGANSVVYLFDDTLRLVMGYSSDVAPYSISGMGSTNVVFSLRGNEIYRHDLVSGKSETMYSLSIPPGRIVTRLTHTSPSMVYLTEGPKTSLDPNQELTLREVNLSTKKVRDIISLRSGVSRSLDYLFLSEVGDIYGIFGGDGCGGSADIYWKGAGDPLRIVQAGFGCSSNPRYIGALPAKNELLMASTTRKEFNPEDITYADGELYTLNVVSGEQALLLKLSSLGDRVQNIVLDELKKKVAIIMSKKIVIFNLDTKAIEKTILYENDQSSFTVFTDSRLYGTDFKRNQYVFVNVLSGKATTLPFADTPEKEGLIFRGTVEGKPLLIKYTPKNP